MTPKLIIILSVRITSHTGVHMSITRLIIDCYGNI